MCCVVVSRESLSSSQSVLPVKLTDDTVTNDDDDDDDDDDYNASLEPAVAATSRRSTAATYVRHMYYCFCFS